MVKKIAVSVLLLLMTVSQSFAMAPINTFVIQDAQEYGRRFAAEYYSSFMAPWTAFEERAQKLSDVTDHAHIFTPYLLIAAAAREKTRSNQPILIENSEKALSQYEGYLVFSVTIHSNNPAALEKVSAKLLQDKQSVQSYYISPPTKTQLAVNGKSLGRAQFYIYFADKTISPNRPIVLILTDAANQKRSFFYDLEKVR